MSNLQTIIDGINAWMPGVTDADLLAFLRLRYANTVESPTDPRDLEHEEKPTSLTTANWNPWVGFIENQQDKPRCVAQSLEVTSRVKTNKARNIECYDPDSGQKMVDFDAQELYYLCKRHDGMPHAEGTSMRIGLKMLQKYGITENRPQENQKYHCGKYRRCRSRKDALNALYTVGPVNIVIRWYISFSFGKGVLTPKTKDRYVGLHAMTLTRRTAEDDAQGVTRGINSYGPDWGEAGHFILPDASWDDIIKEVWCFE